MRCYSLIRKAMASVLGSLSSLSLASPPFPSLPLRSPLPSSPFLLWWKQAVMLHVAQWRDPRGVLRHWGHRCNSLQETEANCQPWERAWSALPTLDSSRLASGPRCLWGGESAPSLTYSCIPQIQSKRNFNFLALCEASNILGHSTKWARQRPTFLNVFPWAFY